MYFLENLEIIVVDSFKFVRCDACGIVGYWYNTRAHGAYVRNGTGDSVAYFVFFINSPIFPCVAPPRLDWT